MKYWKGMKGIEWWWGSNDDDGGKSEERRRRHDDCYWVMALKRWRKVQFLIEREYQDMHNDIEIEIALWLIITLSLVSEIITKLMALAYSYSSSCSVKKSKFVPIFIWAMLKREKNGRKTRENERILLSFSTQPTFSLFLFNTLSLVFLFL